MHSLSEQAKTRAFTFRWDGTIKTIDTDHSPFASRTADTAAIIEAIVRSLARHGRPA